MSRFIINGSELSSLAAFSGKSIFLQEGSLYGDLGTTLRNEPAPRRYQISGVLSHNGK